MAPWKCPDCGVWWSGLEHRCHQPVTLPATTTQPIVIRPYVSPADTGTSSTSGMPYCHICQGWHMPGFGPCTATYSIGAQQ